MVSTGTSNHHSTGDRARAGGAPVPRANTHAEDFGRGALSQGTDGLAAAGGATVGGGADDTAAHAPHVADINGLRVGFLGYVQVPVEAITHFDTETWTATADAPASPPTNPTRPPP